jgi:hypothetical protein
MIRNIKIRRFAYGGVALIIVWLIYSMCGSSELAKNTLSRLTQKQHGKTSSSEGALSSVIASYRKSERNLRRKGPLSKNEVNLYLTRRGKSPSTILFVLLCTEDRAYLDLLREMPDSPMKLQILDTNNYGNPVEKLDYSKRLFDMDPDNKISALRYVDALLANGRESEAATVLASVEKCGKTQVFKDLVNDEFMAAIDIFGTERASELLKSYRDGWARKVSFEVTRLYLDSLDPSPYINGNHFDSDGMQLTTENFLSKIGYSKDRAHVEGMLETRNYLSYLSKKNPSLHLRDQYDQLNRNLDAEFINGFKRGTELNNMPANERIQSIMQSLSP